MRRAGQYLGRNAVPLMVCLLLISPIAISLPEALTSNIVSAASNCSYDSQNSADWHQEVSSFNLTGSSDDDFMKTLKKKISIALD